MKVRHFSLVAIALLVARGAAAQGTISTVAGGNGYLDNVPGTQARLDGPQALAVDPRGNAYIGDGGRIRRVDAKTGIMSTMAADGLGGPMQFAFDSAGNLVFLDSMRVMTLDLQTGTVTTIAGTASVTTAQLGILSGLATDRAGAIYVTDEYNGKIYRIDPVTKAITLIAGIGSGPARDGGPATQASLNRPGPITLDPAGNIFFAEQYFLRRIDAQSGIIATIMPISQSRAYGSGTGDGGPVAKAVLGNASALATDGQGNLYIADGPWIRKIDWSAGTISTVAGSGQQNYVSDGVPALQANLSFMYGIGLDGAGNMWLADQGNRRLFVIAAATGLIRTVAGTFANGDGGPALGALLPYPTGIAISAQGDLYVQSDATRRVDPVTGFISILPATTVSSPGGQLAIDTAGNLFLAASDRIDRIDTKSGSVSIVAGGNGDGFDGDGGTATAAHMSASGVAVDSSGNLYIADYWAYRVRRADAKTGIITTVAGNGQAPGQAYAGETGPAKQIAIGFPTSITVSPSGDVYWTTSGRVLRLDSTGALSIAAGNGGCVYAGDGGPALLASLCEPYALAFDSGGNLFVGESLCGCVRRIDAATGLIQTVAGTGTPGTSLDGIPATQAALTVQGLALAGTTLYIADRAQFDTNGRIRTVSPAVPPALPQPPKIVTVANAVDFGARYSPGAIVSIIGNYLGGPSPASAQLGSDGRVTTVLAEDVVTFNGTAAPLLYVSAAQINTVVPYGVPSGGYPAGYIPVQVKTTAGADTSNIVVTETSLALFPGLVFNPDGSLNSATNPAPKGATLVMYGTGMGQTNPAGVDGAIVNGPDFPRPVAQFSAAVRNGTALFPAEISYIGPLPGFVAGAVQANVRISDSTPPGGSTLGLTSVMEGTGAGQDIYMLSDPPVLTGITPPAPIPQVLGLGNYLTLNGTGLGRIVAVHFFAGGKSVDLQPQSFQACTETSCTYFVNFAGQSGDFGVEVVNAAQQVSNRLVFALQPIGPPTVTDVGQGSAGTPLVALKGNEFVHVTGSSFQSPFSVDVFFNGSRIATLASSSPLQIYDWAPTVIEFWFDFQGNPGQYGIEVACPSGRSSRFSFTVAAP